MPEEMRRRVAQEDPSRLRTRARWHKRPSGLAQGQPSSRLDSSGRCLYCIVKSYLAGTLLRSRGGRLAVDGVSRSQRSGAVLGVATPFGPGLGVHVGAVRVAVPHVRVGGIRRVLAVGVSRTGRRDGRIYRHLGVRIDEVGLMVSPIRLGQRRTVLLLRHAAGGGGRGRVV